MCTDNVRLTRTELETLLRAHRGPSPGSLVARTVPELRQKDNPLAGLVHKLARVQGMLGVKVRPGFRRQPYLTDYARAVNRQRDREGHPGGIFYAQPRAWGQRIPGTPLVEHREKLYLTVKRQTVLYVEYRHAVTNEVLPEDEVEPWLKRRAEGRRQELRQPVVMRDYGLSTVRELRLYGEVYQVISDEELADAA